MAKETWGLDLGEWSFKIARGVADKKAGTIHIDLYDEIRYSDLELEEGAPALEKFRAGLRAFAAKYKVGRSDNLCVAVSGTEVFSRFINLPPVPESIGEIIRYEARQQIPFDISEVVWDYQPIKEEHQPGEEIEVGLFALKRESVGEFMSMLEPWRQNLRVVQSAPLALYNFLRYEEWVNEPLVVLDVGAHSTDVLILNHPRFWVRPLLIAGDDLTETLQSHFGVSLQEAERIKSRASESAHEAQVLRIVRPVVGNIVGEIQRSLGYYKSLARGAKFEKVLALGNAFKLRGLDRLLAEGLQYEILRLEDLKHIVLEPPLNKEEFLPQLGGACVALGLVVQGAGLGHMKINLLPEEFAATRVMNRKRPWLAAAAVGLVGISLAFVMSERAFSRELKSKTQEGQDLYTKLTQHKKAYDAAHGQTQVSLAKIQGLAASNVDRDILMRDLPLLSTYFPQEVYVLDMSTAWMEPAEANVRLAGIRMDMPTVSGGGAAAVPELPTGPPAWMMGGGGPGGGMPFGARPMGGPPAAASAAGSLKSENSVLLVSMGCESSIIREGLTFIQDQVVAKLKDATHPNGTHIFEDVKLVGNLTSLFRGPNGVVVGDPGLAGSDDVQQLVSFRLFGVLNTSDTRWEKPEGAAGAKGAPAAPRK